MAYLSDELYKTVTDNIPIVCVDVIPVRKENESYKIGLITRATGTEAGKLALIGGRVDHNELITDAIARHLLKDCEVTDYSFVSGNSVERPFYVQQYLHQPHAEPPLGFDSTKHAVALTYLIELSEDPNPQNEASAFEWASTESVPKIAGYNQHVLMRAAFDFLDSN